MLTERDGNPKSPKTRIVLKKGGFSHTDPDEDP